MTFEQWAEHYKPVPNPHNTNASYDGTMFETYGVELQAVKEADPACVWTLCEEGGSFVAQGFRLVNRMGYFITAVPAGDDAPFHIDIDIDDEEDEEGSEEE